MLELFVVKNKVVRRLELWGSQSSRVIMLLWARVGTGQSSVEE